MMHKKCNIFFPFKCVTSSLLYIDRDEAKGWQFIGSVECLFSGHKRDNTKAYKYTWIIIINTSANM
jgi:hypothetical protein